MQNLMVYGPYCLCLEVNGQSSLFYFVAYYKNACNDILVLCGENVQRKFENSGPQKLFPNVEEWLKYSGSCYFFKIKLLNYFFVYFLQC